ncbi:MAG: alpha-L-rhamnosidase C-terminal domain-containing protein, partial [Clostridia bacterium]|nr:alpha-L-rhamnosidase C-terminal domain-containing protein [Clostridia bacterium]
GGVDFYMYVMNGSVGWADAGVIIPYVLWKQYGDIGAIGRKYDGMKKYAEFMISRCGKWGGPYAKPIKIKPELNKYLVNCGQSYGEWAEPEDFYVMKWTDFCEPHPEVSTAYTSYIMKLMIEIAEALGKTEDIPLYTEYSEGCKKAYQEMAKQKNFTLDTDRQARLVRPLSFNLLDGPQTEYAKKRLIKALENYGFRLGTGFLSTPLILDVLCEYDADAAYKLLENEEIPGWLSMPKNGATTIWESWEGKNVRSGGVASLNHYSKGAVCRWLFDTMCGIRIAGENHFVLKPLPGGSFTHAKAEYNSIYGKVCSSWQKTDEGYSYSIKVPSNCTAEIVLPNGEHLSVNSGQYTI